MRISVGRIDEDMNIDLKRLLHQYTVPVGVLLDGYCDNTQRVIDQASTNKLFDGVHAWLIFTNITDYANLTEYIDNTFSMVNLSIDADIAIVAYSGLDIMLNGYKYYDRWDFHNLTLRAISVIVERPKEFSPDILSEIGYTAGVAAMTKITSQLLNILKEQHNFRTKIYYLMPNKGVGDYENQFLSPMSYGVWLCALFSCIACTMVLAGAALMENRPEPGTYAFFSVFAILCQDAFEDGVPLPEEKESQGRRLTLMVIGVMSMLLYNYYTSSVVSWLLNAAAPSIANLDGLINSDFEIIFEDIGYTRGWLDNPGFFYYSGFTNAKEDELRDKKVTNGKRTVGVLQSVNNGIELVRTGKYAFHTEPYTASQVISKTFEEEDLCNLGALQMMMPAHVYIMVQKKSPYKEFLDWSLLRLTERGHMKATRARFAGTIPACSGIKPRALALGQAAPAFLLLFEMTVLAWMIFALEVLWHKRKAKKRGSWSGPRVKKAQNGWGAL
ncbi:unnamed protein product [Arctia plantaginis]|uniref:Ionotropic receptor 75a N-terminal domain-containing protein n=1 Tax=Arctia plantaginis TaxID=874455 RepID=A0A8S1AWF2_ARCPL|nr:unnamed protein product [Arctia plantaginis]